ncbi:hypothetical protein ONZ45_g3266 [Pleurotus djamor]|nr:hypothetical protein ONZ45_g3266 [Pleurotus djamor]
MVAARLEIADLRDRIKELEEERGDLQQANRDLRMESAHFKSRLRTVTAAIAQAVTCTICSGYTTKFYITVEERNQIWKEARVSQRIKLIAGGMTRSDADLRAVKMATRLFTYPCPVCRERIRNPPVEVLAGRTLCRVYEDAILYYTPLEERPDEVEEAELTDFDPLFVNADVVLNEFARA